MIEGVDAHDAPDRRFWHEAVLSSRGESEILFDFHLPLLKPCVGRAEFLLCPDLLGDVSKRRNLKPTSAILEDTRTDDDGQTTTALSRKHKLKTVLPL